MTGWRRRSIVLTYRFESFLELALCKSCILWLPFSVWSRFCGRYQYETLKTDVIGQRDRILAIRRALKWTARYVPWKSQCLDQAIAAQRMLSRRELSTTLYLGMKKNPQSEWTAHAWVRCGDQWVIGEPRETGYTVVGTYARTC